MGTIYKPSIVVARYANVDLRRGVWGLHRKHSGESVVPARECSPVTNVMPTTADRTNKASPFARNSINAKQCNKVISHQKRKPEDHMCGEKMCWNCEEFVDPNMHVL